MGSQDGCPYRVLVLFPERILGTTEQAADRRGLHADGGGDVRVADVFGPQQQERRLTTPQRRQHLAHLAPFLGAGVQIGRRPRRDAEVREHALDAGPALIAPPGVEGLARRRAIEPALGAVAVRRRMPLPAQEDVGGDLLGARLVVDDASDHPRQPRVVGAEQLLEAIARGAAAAGSPVVSSAFTIQERARSGFCGTACV